MKINRALNLVVLTETDEGSPVYVHSTPLSKDIFRENFLILGQLFGAFFSSGLGMLSSARTAYLLLEKISKEANAWDGKDGVKNTLVTHIINGSTAIYAEEGHGWKSLPLSEAINRGVVDINEVMDELVFFTCVCAMTKSTQSERMVMDMAEAWGSSVTSLSYMDFMNSLTTSQTAETSAPKEPESETDLSGATPLSIPS